jgi:hypothetical protein
MAFFPYEAVAILFDFSCKKSKWLDFYESLNSAVPKNSGPIFGIKKHYYLIFMLPFLR